MKQRRSRSTRRRSSRFSILADSLPFGHARQPLMSLLILCIILSITCFQPSLAGRVGHSLLQSRRLRGGENDDFSALSSAGGLDDDELDEYIEFLLAAAEDKVSESDNPLFKRKKRQEAAATSPSLAEEEVNNSQTASLAAESIKEETTVDHETVVAGEESVMLEVSEPADVAEETISQVVENVDVDDDAQLDDMVESLVASVGDEGDETIMEEGTIQESIDTTILETPDQVELVDDVEDEAQLDTMIESLVASVDDEDVAATLNDAEAEQWVEEQLLEASATEDQRAEPEEVAPIEEASEETVLAAGPDVEAEPHKVTIESPAAEDGVLEEIDESAIPVLAESMDTDAPEELVQTEVEADDYSSTATAATTEEQDPEFFLGPSAVEDVPPLVVEAGTANEDDSEDAASVETLEAGEDTTDVSGQQETIQEKLSLWSRFTKRIKSLTLDKQTRAEFMAGDEASPEAITSGVVIAQNATLSSEEQQEETTLDAATTITAVMDSENVPTGVKEQAEAIDIIVADGETDLSVTVEALASFLSEKERLDPAFKPVETQLPLEPAMDAAAPDTTNLVEAEASIDVPDTEEEEAEVIVESLDSPNSIDDGESEESIPSVTELPIAETTEAATMVPQEMLSELGLVPVTEDERGIEPTSVETTVSEDDSTDIINAKEATAEPSLTGDEARPERVNLYTKLRTYQKDSIFAVSNKTKRAWGTVAAFLAKPITSPLIPGRTETDEDVVDGEDTLVPQEAVGTASADIESTGRKTDPDKIFEKYFGTDSEYASNDAETETEADVPNATLDGSEKDDKIAPEQSDVQEASASADTKKPIHWFWKSRIAKPSSVWGRLRGNTGQSVRDFFKKRLPADSSAAESSNDLMIGRDDSENQNVETELPLEVETFDEYDVSQDLELSSSDDGVADEVEQPQPIEQSKEADVLAEGIVASEAQISEEELEHEMTEHDDEILLESSSEEVLSAETEEDEEVDTKENAVLESIQMDDSLSEQIQDEGESLVSDEEEQLPVPPESDAVDASDGAMSADEADTVEGAIDIDSTILLDVDREDVSQVVEAPESALEQLDDVLDDTYEVVSEEPLEATAIAGEEHPVDAASIPEPDRVSDIDAGEESIEVEHAVLDESEAAVDIIDDDEDFVVTESELAGESLEVDISMVASGSEAMEELDNESGDGLEVPEDADIEERSELNVDIIVEENSRDESSPVEAEVVVSDDVGASDTDEISDTEEKIGGIDESEVISEESLTTGYSEEVTASPESMDEDIIEEEDGETVLGAVEDEEYKSGDARVSSDSEDYSDFEHILDASESIGGGLAAIDIIVEDDDDLSVDEDEGGVSFPGAIEIEEEAVEEMTDIGVHSEGDDVMRPGESLDTEEASEEEMWSDDVEAEAILDEMLAASEDAEVSDAEAGESGIAAQLHDSLRDRPVNFFYRFLLARGLNVVVTFFVLIVEWCKLYLAPIAEIPKIPGWILRKEAQPILRFDKPLSTLTDIRGGGDGSDSEEEDHADVEEEEASDLDPEEMSDQAEDAGSKEKDKNEGNSAEVDAKSPESDGESDVTGDTSAPKAANIGPRDMFPPSRKRPNGWYRFLLGSGSIGHVMVLESIMVREWIHTYIPPLDSLLTVIGDMIFPGSKRPLREREDDFVSQTTGFVSNDGSAVRGGKKRKSQTKKDDQKALSQMQRLGDVSVAKYRFLSESFMKRHGLGEFASQIAERPRAEPGSEASGVTAEEDVDESDAGWVVDALTQDQDVDDSPINTSMGVALGSEGASVSVGVEFNFGKAKKKKRKKRPSLSEVAMGVSAGEEKAQKAGPRVSDREGGGGVMGRIRAAGANSLVGRSLLGAYPGDAPPPNEAASHLGLLNLAYKYGYGDLSDDEDDARPTKRAKRRSRPASSASVKRRRKDNAGSIGIEFDFGSGADDPPNVTSRKKPTSRHKRVATPAGRKVKGNTRLGSSEGLLDSTSDKFVQPAMQTLKALEESHGSGSKSAKKRKRKVAPKATETTVEKGDENSVSVTKSARKKRRRKVIKPAMAELGEVRSTTKIDDNSTGQAEEDGS